MTNKPSYNIGLLLIATGKYDVFIDQLVASARKHLFNDHKLTFFIFTDSLNIKKARDIKVIKHEHTVWPFPTLYRYKTFITNKDAFKKMDYLYYCDVDMLFVDDIGNEAIGTRVATVHPGYWFENTSGSPERNPQSTAYIPHGTPNKYYAGGFNGGIKETFLSMAKTIDANIDADYKKNKFIAIWHDESHMNNYFWKNPPTVTLSPSYCYGESMKLPFKKKLIALDKDHNYMRSPN